MPIDTTPNPVKSADRALALLEFIAATDGATFSEIMGALKLPRSSTHGLLQTLTNSGWIRHDATTKRFSLGLLAWQVGQRYTGHRDLVNTAKPVMDRLAAETGETVQLSRLDGVENVYIAISESANPMRMVSSPGMRLPAYATGLGKALLSSIDTTDAENRLRSIDLEPFTARTVVDVNELLAILENTRTVGYATDDEELVAGCRCVAVPLTNERDTGLVSAMSITMPTSRTGKNWPDALVEPLVSAADSIRRQLGARHPHGRNLDGSATQGR